MFHFGRNRVFVCFPACLVSIIGGSFAWAGHVVPSHVETSSPPRRAVEVHALCDFLARRFGTVLAGWRAMDARGSWAEDGGRGRLALGDDDRGGRLGRVHELFFFGRGPEMVDII